MINTVSKIGEKERGGNLNLDNVFKYTGGFLDGTP